MAISGSQKVSPTYHKDVAPLLNRSCLPCHAANGHGPFELTAYEHFKKRLSLVRTVLVSRGMPPYRAFSDFADFCPQPLLTDEELVLVQKWFQAGAPEGQSKAADSTVGAPSTPAKDTLTVGKNYSVEKEGGAYWLAFPCEAPNDLPLTGLQVEVRAPRAVRRVLLARDLNRWKTDEPVVTSGSPSTDFEPLLTWAAGHPNPTLPDGYSIQLKKGERLWVQVLYVPTGKPEPGQVSLGLRSEPIPTNPSQDAFSRVLQTSDLVIPAKKDRRFEQSFVTDKALSVLGITPFARFYATQVRITAQEPEKEPRNLLHVPSWGPYWVGGYVFPKAVPLPKGTKITATIEYDNSEHAPINDGKIPVPVTSGNKRTDEIFTVFLLLAQQKGLTIKAGIHERNQASNLSLL